MFQAKKTLILILALLMVLTAFAACDRGTPDAGPEESESSQTSTDDGTGNTDNKNDSILNGVSFEGTTLFLLKGNAVELDEYIEELTEGASLVEKAIFDRCDYAETRLKLRTQWTPVADASLVETADLSNSTGGTYDIIVNKSSRSAALMTRGVLSNLTQYPYLDFDSEGWATSLLSDVMVGNKLYFATGDISPNLLFMTSVVFFNKDLVETLGINEKIQTNWDKTDLYELVTSGTWTLDKMVTLCEDVYADKNNSGFKDTGDRFGFNTYSQLLENFYYGGNHTVIVPDGDGFILSQDFMNPILVGDILETVNGLLHDSNDGFLEKGQKQHNYDETRLNFSEGNVLFCMAPASHAYNTHSNTEKLNYGVLPVPKHSESQENYACTQSFPYCMYSITSQGKNRVPASAFMQALSEESYTTTRPALLDKMMKGRYAEEPQDAEMWDYAVDSNIFDVGRVFQELFNDPTEGYLTINLFRARIEGDNENWSVILDTYGMPMAWTAADLAGQIMALPD